MNKVFLLLFVHKKKASAFCRLPCVFSGFHADRVKNVAFLGAVLDSAAWDAI